MKKYKLIVLLTVGLLFVTGCQKSEAGKEEPKAQLETAAELLKEVDKNFKGMTLNNYSFRIQADEFTGEDVKKGFDFFSSYEDLDKEFNDKKMSSKFTLSEGGKDSSLVILAKEGRMYINDGESENVADAAADTFDIDIKAILDSIPLTAIADRETEFSFNDGVYTIKLDANDSIESRKPFVAMIDVIFNSIDAESIDDMTVTYAIPLNQKHFDINAKLNYNEKGVGKTRLDFTFRFNSEVEEMPN